MKKIFTCRKTTVHLNSALNDPYDQPVSSQSDKNLQSPLQLNTYRNLNCQQGTRLAIPDPSEMNVLYPPNRLLCPTDDDSQVYTNARHYVVAVFPWLSCNLSSPSTNHQLRMVKWIWSVGCWRAGIWDSHVNISQSNTVVLVLWMDFWSKSDRSEIDKFAIALDLKDQKTCAVHRQYRLLFVVHKAVNFIFEIALDLCIDMEVYRTHILVDFIEVYNWIETGWWTLGFVVFKTCREHPSPLEFIYFSAHAPKQK